VDCEGTQNFRKVLAETPKETEHRPMVTVSKEIPYAMVYKVCRVLVAIATR